MLSLKVVAVGEEGEVVVVMTVVAATVVVVAMVVVVAADTVPPFGSYALSLHRHLPQLHHRAPQLAALAVVGQI